MSFPTGWTKKCSLTIDNTKVSGTANLSNFPVLLTEVNFPSTIFDNTIATGADLRFTSDEAGTTELAFEVVNWDTTNDKAEVWVKVPTVDYDDDTVFYVWYGNATATAYAHTDTYGTHACWDDYDLVFHMESESSLIDSSPNGYNMAAIGTPISTTGKVGKGVEFNGSNIGYARKLVDSPNLTGTTSFTYTMWAQTHANGWDYTYCVGWDNVSGGRADTAAIDGSRACYWGSSGLVAPHPKMTLNTWHHLTIGYDAVNQKAYFVKDGDIGTGVIDSTTARLQIGLTGRAGGDTAVSVGCESEKYGTYKSWWDGYIDELRVQNTIYRTPGWSITEYNNQSAPSTFVTEGTETDVGSTGISASKRSINC